MSKHKKMTDRLDELLRERKEMVGAGMDRHPAYEPSFVQLEREIFIARQHIDQHEIDLIKTRHEIDHWYKAATRQLVKELRIAVWKEALPTQTFSYPANWWQAVKERWFPDWLLRRFPVVYNKITCTLDRLYPDLPPPVQGESPVRKFAIHHEPSLRP